MNCFHCGAQLPLRPVSRSLMTGTIIIAAGFVLLLFVHLAVIVLASVILVAAGATIIRGAFQAHVLRCPSCGTLQRSARQMKR